MNFESHSIHRFKVGIDFYRRIYHVDVNKNGTLKLINVLNGKPLFENIIPNTILINGNPMNNIDELQRIVYNQSCECNGEIDDSEYKIFDLTFDNTFE